MSQFKPGDLALIKICKTAPEMVGKCVELVMSAAPGVQFQCHGLNWQARAEHSWVVTGDSLIRRTYDGKLHASQVAMFRESSLMPLKGDLQPEQQKAKEVEPCL